MGESIYQADGDIEFHSKAKDRLIPGYMTKECACWLTLGIIFSHFFIVIISFMLFTFQTITYQKEIANEVSDIRDNVEMNHEIISKRRALVVSCEGGGEVFKLK